MEIFINADKKTTPLQAKYAGFSLTTLRVKRGAIVSLHETGLLTRDLIAYLLKELIDMRCGIFCREWQSSTRC